MAPPDEEDKAVSCSVSDYEFVVDENAPISFAKLPLYWNKVETPSGKQRKIFLRGNTDRRIRNIYKQVIAWRFDISFEKPEISVLSKEGYWIKISKPRKSFAKYIRKILITVHALHFMKWNPKRSWRALWDHLSSVLSMSMFQPSVGDLVDHLSLITETVKRDETLAKCELLIAFLKEKPGTMKPSIKHSHCPPTHASVVKDGIGKNDGGSVEDDVCAICDNGGRLLICEGKCLRSFHPTVEDGSESSCPSLGYTEAEYEAIEKVEFYCKNCELKQHQCFGCGNLGSSDELSGAEVFRCVNGACGFFYHPHCVAKLLHPGDEAAAEEHRKKIAGGKQFACPRHICYSCKELEVGAVSDLQFAICRRCPRSYHIKCLPRKIAFEEDVDESKGIVQRAWRGLIPNDRILIYCLKHDIDLKTSTPVRNHIKFPVSEPMESLRGQSIESEDSRNAEPIVKRADNSLNLDADKKKRIFTAMKNASSSVRLEKIKEKHKAPSVLTQSSSSAVDFTSGKVECSVEDVRAALQNLEGGGSFDDAKAFCGTGFLFQAMNWKIVDKLHWYVQDGDMVVDFCCGSNDFSCFMKKKLNEVGKSCSFKNYDLLQAKNDFNFERKDWMEVRPDELLEGSRLIIGLHPPSGTDGDVDVKFINKAIEFKPKLLILIAPRGMQRLDNKDFPYDLIWEDDQMFTGNSFYVPGSVNVNGKQLEDLNVNAPILNLWSSSDWTQKHKAIAKQHGHLSETQTNPELKEKQDLAHSDDCLVNSASGEGNLTDNKQQTLEQDTLTTTEDCTSCSNGSAGEKNRALACESGPLWENPNMFGGMKRKRPPSNAVSDENHSNSANSHSTSDPSPNGKITRSDDSILSEVSLTNGSKEPMPPIRVRPLGFASGPCLPFPPQNSAGWLEE